MSSSSSSSEDENEQPKRPFSFFASAEDVELTDSDDSDADEESGGHRKQRRGDQRKGKESNGEPEAKKSKGQALPSVDDLLSDHGLAKPSFLENQLTAQDIETFDKREPEQLRTPWIKRPGEGKTDAEKAREEMKKKKRAEQLAKADGAALEAMAAAHAFSSMYKSNVEELPQPPAAAAEEAARGGGVGDQDDGSKTFRAKEKRKRDLGQANREKSWVEEEKRKLRETMPNMGYGFD